MRHLMLLPLPHVARRMLLVALLFFLLLLLLHLTRLLLLLLLLLVLSLCVCCVRCVCYQEKTWPTYEFINRFLDSGKKGLQKLEESADSWIRNQKRKSTQAHKKPSLKICKAFGKAGTIYLAKTSNENRQNKES